MHSGIWEGVTAGLLENFRVTVVDLPGHGFSRFVKVQDNLEELCISVAAAVPAPAAWIGWSLGGLIAQQIAITTPEKVTRLVLTNSTPCFVQQSGWQHAISLVNFQDFTEALYRDYHALLNRFITLEVCGSANAIAQLHYLRELLFQRGEPAFSALDNGLKILGGTDLRSEWPRISCPIMLLMGRCDRLVPASVGEVLLGKLSNIRLKVFEQAGHVPFLSHLPDFISALRAFLDE
jgi:pimeloyl-[acyl-carrier protein] methyl ester esterase